MAKCLLADWAALLEICADWPIESWGDWPIRLRRLAPIGCRAARQRFC